MSESPKKSPRQRFREEHAQFLEGLSAGLTDLEIMRRMGWTKLQLKRHQAEAFAADISGQRRPIGRFLGQTCRRTFVGCFLMRLRTRC